MVNEIVPRLRSAVPLVARCVGAEDPEELIGDATLHAARILHSAEARHKDITPGNACYYAIQHCKSGRRSVGNSSVDVMAAGTQLHGHSRLDSLETVVAEAQETGGEIYLLHDVLASDQEDPATRAARSMDWSEFALALTERERAAINCLVEGRSLRDVAKSFRVCDSTMQGDKRKLAIKIKEFFGSDILAQVRKLPRRKDDLMTSREKLTCKHERSH